MKYLLISAALAVFFYVLIPGLGAFQVRWRWRLFRRLMIESSFSPIAGYSTFHRGEEGSVGTLRFFGGLQAIQGNDTVWVSDGSVSVSAELKGAQIFVLPDSKDESGGGELKVTESPRKIPWEKISSLPEGAKIFLCGSVSIEQGKGVFRPVPGVPLIAVIYEGEDGVMFRQSIWSGRQMNEYWNPFTPVSLAAGFFSLFLMGYVLLQEPYLRIEALIALLLSLLPVLPLFPPGLLFFALYRMLWKKGRTQRAYRDVFYLPMRYFKIEKSSGAFPPEPVNLPSGEIYGVVRISGAEGLETLPSRPDIRLCPPDAERSSDFCIFGSLDEGRVRPPRDPFAEYLAVRGNPDMTAQLCHKRARLYEASGLASFCVSILVNLVLAFAILLPLVR